MYSKNPKIHKNAKLIKEIKNIDSKIENFSSKTTSKHGTGGMKTKIDAAKDMDELKKTWNEKMLGTSPYK